nr:tetratricopeptide repeat protein [Pseudomonadota bacterium]
APKPLHEQRAAFHWHGASFHNALRHAEALPEALRPLLAPLALHERFVQADFLKDMAKAAQAPQDRAAIDRLLGVLETAGLAHPHGQGIYGLHPALTGFLRARGCGQAPADESWRRAFVDVMGSLADYFAPKPLHEQRAAFHWHGASFHNALRHAEALGMDDDVAAITQALAAYALNHRDFANARRYFEKRAEHAKARSEPGLEASAYHQLGIIAQAQRDFAQARQWYLKALAITEKQGNEHGVAITYQALGALAGIQQHYIESGQWTLKAIRGYVNSQDPHYAQQTVGNFLLAYKQAPPADQATLKSLWNQAGLGAFPGEGEEG